MAPPVSISRILRTLRQIAGTLKELDEPWALVGGLAVSLRTEPRFTRDVDLAAAVADDAAAESLVHRLAQSGYKVLTAIEHESARRLATVRLLPPGEAIDGVVVDILLASSGIEREIVSEAEAFTLMPGFTVPVARLGHLVAVKLLAVGPHRRHDAADLDYLLDGISPDELARARTAIALIQQRGFHRGKPLAALLDSLIASS